MVKKNSAFNIKRDTYTTKQLLSFYRELLFPRLIEEKMLLLLRQGKISKWFSGIGQEAIAVGAVTALKADEYILPVHRNLGVFTGRKIPLAKLLAQWQGSKKGFTKGRDRSFHFGTQHYHIIGMISHLGAQLPVATGIALGHLLKKESKVVVAFTGEGGTSEGDFHEALNIAAVWQLPVIFLVENNGYALSTPVQEQFYCKSLADKGIGYGMEAVEVDGNDLLAVYRTMSHYAQKIRENPGPVMVVANTFRVRGHEEASGTDYVPDELITAWKEKDPVKLFENFLKNQGILHGELQQEIQTALEDEIADQIKDFDKEHPGKFEQKEELADVYFQENAGQVDIAVNNSTPEKRFIDALNEGLYQAMEKFPSLILMGQDIAGYGGVFKVTASLSERFGTDRVRNTPLCESGVLGAALGLAINGMKSVVEMQFADFISCGFNQVVNNLAKSHYRWGQSADTVIRMPTGGNTGAGPFHSQSTEAWFFHTPGLKIVYPSNAYDAKGLLLMAIEDPNPVLFYEHKFLYRTNRAAVPDEYYTLPLGKARLLMKGDAVSVITYGLGVRWGEEALEALEINGDLLDLCSLSPWDQEAVKESVKKTGKVLVLHEDCFTGGIGAEIAAWISENCFEYLDAPVMREGSLDTPVPFNKELEADFLPMARLKDKLQDLFAY